MWIKAARIDGFGRLLDKTFTFTPGLNCIHGPNESGKTTLLAFLISMLYGQAKSGIKIRHLDISHQRYDPWRAPLYGGDLVVSLSSGAEIVLKRGFADDADRIEILDATTGASLLGDYARDRRREYEFVLSHTGVDKRTFTAAFVIHHSSLARLSKGGAGVLADRLVALADTGSEDTSAKHAIEMLTKLRASIGSEGAYTQSYARTMKSLESERDTHKKILQARTEYGAALQAKSELEAKVANGEQALAFVRARHLHSVAGSLDALEKERHALAEEAQALGGPPGQEKLPPIDTSKLRAAERALGDFARLRTGLNERTAALADRTATLERMKSQWTAGSMTLQAITDDHRSFIASAADSKSTMLEELTRKREVLAEAKALSGRKRANSALVVLCLAASLIAAAVSYHFAAGRTRTIGAAVVLLFGGGAVAALAFRGARLSKALGKYAQTQAETDELEGRLSRHDLRLDEVLQAFGAESREDVIAALSEFDREKQAIDDAEKELQALNVELAPSRSAAEAAFQKAAEAALAVGIPACASLSDAVADLLAARTPPEGARGLEDAFTDVSRDEDAAGHLEPLYTHVADAARNREQLEKLHSKIRELESRMDALRGGRPTREILDEAAQAPPLATGTELIPAEKLSAARRDIEAAEQELAALRIELAEVSARVSEAMKAFPDIAEVEENIAALEKRHAAQILHRDAMDEAIAVIGTAAAAFHERVYPRIQSHMDNLLGRVTLGAHQETRLFTEDAGAGAQLTFSVTDTIKNAPVATEALSRGAQEQVYLCARLALAEALSTSERLPVILDDPFINYDAGRLSAAMDVLHEVSQDRQVFLFTCQQDVRDLAARRGVEAIELAGGNPGQEPRDS